MAVRISPHITPVSLLRATEQPASRPKPKAKASWAPASPSAARVPWAPGQSKSSTTPAEAQKSETALHQEQVTANRGYGGAFVMLDLTHTPAHDVRVEIMNRIRAHHDSTPGGILFSGQSVDANESHISLIRGVRAKLLHPDRVLAGEEKEADGHVAAFEALGQLTAPTLKLNAKVEYWDGPAVGKPQYRVVALTIEDPNHCLPAMQTAWAKAGGTHVPSKVSMHLTLAYLKLGENLPTSLEKEIKGIVEKSKDWQQTAIQYSGRYGKVFAETALRKPDNHSSLPG